MPNDEKICNKILFLVEILIRFWFNIVYTHGDFLILNN